MTGDPVPCPGCGEPETRIAWSRGSIWKAAVNSVLIPAWMFAGYFGDMKGASLRLERRCDRCGTHFAPKGPLARRHAPHDATVGR